MRCSRSWYGIAWGAAEEDTDYSWGAWKDTHRKKEPTTTKTHESKNCSKSNLVKCQGSLFYLVTKNQGAWKAEFVVRYMRCHLLIGEVMEQFFQNKNQCLRTPFKLVLLYHILFASLFHIIIYDKPRGALPSAGRGGWFSLHYIMSFPYNSSENIIPSTS